MEELIQLQKREEAAQKAATKKAKQMARKAATTDQGSLVTQWQSVEKRGKKKGITISEGVPRATRSVPTDNASKSKKDGKKRVEEQAEAPPAIQQRTSPGGTIVCFCI